MIPRLRFESSRRAWQRLSRLAASTRVARRGDRVAKPCEMFLPCLAVDVDCGGTVEGGDGHVP